MVRCIVKNNKWAKFRTKETINAFQMTKSIYDELIKTMISKGDVCIVYNDVEFLLRVESDRTTVLAMKRTLENECEVSVNDWIIENEYGITKMSDECFREEFECVVD